MSRLTDHDDFLALRPFFRIVEEALTGIVDGDDFFDMLAEDIVVDYVITVPGYPRRVVGRDAVADLYRPYGTQLTLDRCFDLAVCHDKERAVIVLEYASEGSVVATGANFRGNTELSAELICKRAQARRLIYVPSGTSCRGLSPPIRRRG